MLQDPADDRAGARPDPDLAPPRADRRPRHQHRRRRDLHGLGARRPPPRAASTGSDARPSRYSRRIVPKPAPDLSRSPISDSSMIDRHGATRRCACFCRRHPVDPAWRPFCSERCKLQDLARWADGRYRVAGEPVPDDPTDAGRRPDPTRLDTALMADTLTITDNRTGKQYELPIQDGTIRAMDLRQIKAGAGRLRADDLRPGVHEHRVLPQRASPTSTATRASCVYRGYPIEQLAEHSDYLETAYLILFGELPTDGAARRRGRSEITHAHDAAREHQEAHGRVPVRRASDGHLPQHRRRALDVLPGRQADLRRASRASSRSTG